MYTLEERLLAVNTYYEMGRSATARLGYPGASNLTRWVKEHERDQSLHKDTFGHCNIKWNEPVQIVFLLISCIIWVKDKEQKNRQ